MEERQIEKYTIKCIWNNGCIDVIKVTSNTMANMMLNSLLLDASEFIELSVYIDNDEENALFYILDSKYTSRALAGYWKIPF